MRWSSSSHRYLDSLSPEQMNRKTARWLISKVGTVGSARCARRVEAGPSLDSIITPFFTLNLGVRLAGLGKDVDQSQTNLPRTTFRSVTMAFCAFGIATRGGQPATDGRPHHRGPYESTSRLPFLTRRRKCLVHSSILLIMIGTVKSTTNPCLRTCSNLHGEGLASDDVHFACQRQ